MINLVFVATTHCQLSCPHCLRGEAGPQELSFDVFKKTVEGASAYGIENIHLTGGEPFLYSHLEQVFSLVSEKKLQLTFSTNGLLLAKQRHLLEKYPQLIRMLNVSLDSADKEVYESIRGRNNFSLLLENLQLLRELKIPFSTLTCLNRSNEGQVSRVLRFARYKGAASAVFTTVLPCERSRRNEMGLSEPVRRRLLAELRRNQHIHSFDPLNIFSVPVGIGEPIYASNQQIEMCANQAMRNLTIDVDGSLHFCCFLTVYGIDRETEKRIKIVPVDGIGFDEVLQRFSGRMELFLQERISDFKNRPDKESLDFNSCFYCHQKLGL